MQIPTRVFQIVELVEMSENPGAKNIPRHKIIFSCEVRKTTSAKLS